MPALGMLAQLSRAHEVAGHRAQARPCCNAPDLQQFIVDMARQVRTSPNRSACSTLLCRNTKNLNLAHALHHRLAVLHWFHVAAGYHLLGSSIMQASQ